MFKLGGYLVALIDKHSRFFVRHHLSFRSRHKRGIPLEFIAEEGDTVDIHSLVQAAISKDKAKFEIRVDDEVRLTKLDVRLKDEIAIFLFRRSDPGAAAQVLENRKTKKLRPVQIGDDEYPAISAHLFVQLKKQRLSNPTYRALLEEVPGLGRTYMHHVLNGIARDFKYEFEEKKKTHETYTLVGFDGVPSDTLGSALKGSEVPYVELVRPGHIPGLDTGGRVEAREERMKLMIRADKPGQVMEAINAIKDWMVEWSEMRVRLDLPEDRSRLIPITRQQDAKDVLFIRSVQVLAKKALPACTDIINEELVQHAQALFAKKD